MFSLQSPATVPVPVPGIPGTISLWRRALLRLRHVSVYWRSILGAIFSRTQLIAAARSRAILIFLSIHRRLCDADRPVYTRRRVGEGLMGRCALHSVQPGTRQYRDRLCGGRIVQPYRLSIVMLRPFGRKELQPHWPPDQSITDRSAESILNRSIDQWLNKREFSRGSHRSVVCKYLNLLNVPAIICPSSLFWHFAAASISTCPFQILVSKFPIKIHRTTCSAVYSIQLQSAINHAN